jgi:ApaG protein
LISRHWHITDGTGISEDIYGPGVIGKKPTIEPNTFFEYTSFCPLRTPVGFMEGSYRMLNKDGEEFDLKINKFRLLASQFLN